MRADHSEGVCLDEAAMRAAITARDAEYDGRFVYGVLTTGVFCRPSCKARPARPENLRFFADCAGARVAGFRPCKRCRPDDAAVAADALARIARLIEVRADEPLPLTLLAREAGLSPGRLQRAFTAAFGASPKAYQAQARLKRFKAALRDGEGVLRAGYEAGYGSSSRMHARADDGLGMAPSAYRAGGAGETIAYAARETAFGLLMMAASARGVCFVEFGESQAALQARLVAEFPKAALAPAGPDADAPLAAWIEALDAHLSQHAPRPDLPLDLRGTAFQVAVWRFLLRVKPGEVVNYAELAAGAGAPQAVRAAASACAANRIGVLIPCHRALRADGGLGGYRWAEARKRALLDAERRARATS